MRRLLLLALFCAGCSDPVPAEPDGPPTISAAGELQAMPDPDAPWRYARHTLVVAVVGGAFALLLLRSRRRALTEPGG